MVVRRGQKKGGLSGTSVPLNRVEKYLHAHRLLVVQGVPVGCEPALCPRLSGSVGLETLCEGFDLMRAVARMNHRITVDFGQRLAVYSDHALLLY